MLLAEFIYRAPRRSSFVPFAFHSSPRLSFGMAAPLGNSSASLDTKEKDSEAFASVKELEAPQEDSKLTRFSNKFNAWLASRGLEGHGYAYYIHRKM